MLKTLASTTIIKKKIINNLNILFDTSKPTFVSGISGKGKTTLLSLICGFLKPHKGQILFDGVELKSIHQFSKNLIGYISQESFLIDETIDSNITFGLKKDKIDKERLEDIKSLLGINENNYGENFNESKIGENGSKLSGGQKQRISLARALFHERDIIFLDESTSSLDLASEKSFIELLKKDKNLTKIIITHKKNYINYCNLKIFFNKNNIKVIRK